MESYYNLIVLKVLVLCNWGNSSGQLARSLSHKFDDVTSEERGIQKDDLKKEINKWDIVVIAPHIKHHYQELKTNYFNDIPVIVAETVAYYSCNAKAIRKQINKELRKGG